MGILPGVMRQQSFRHLFAARTISKFGSSLAPVALAFAVLDIGDASDLGVIIAVGTIPALVFILLGGVLADRWSPQRLMLYTDIGATVTQAVTALLLLTDTAELWHLAVLQFLWGTQSSLFNPASNAIVPLVVRRGELQEANAALSLSRNIALIGGPTAAGLIVAFLSPGWAFAIDACTFAISSLFMLKLQGIAKRSTEMKSMWKDLLEGWTELTQRRWLWTSISYFSLFHVVYIAPITVLGPVVANDELGGARSWGTILTSAAIGGLIGALLGFRLQPDHKLFVMLAMGYIWIPQLAFLAMASSLTLIAVAAFANGIAMGYSATLWETIVQEHVPQRALARIYAYDWLGSQLFLPVGTAVMGFAGERFGTGPTLWACVLGLAISTTGVLAVRDVRTLDSSGARPDGSDAHGIDIGPSQRLVEPLQ